MHDWLLEDIISGTGGQRLGGPDVPLTGFSIDTRTLQPGEVYVAIKGERLDGHDYVMQAIKQGAGAIVASRVPSCVKPGEGPAWIAVRDTLEALQNLACWQRRRHLGRFLGVTGSNGKTTVKEILLHLFSAENRTWASPGNFNNHIGLPLNLLRMPLDAQYAIVEMGMNHAGEIRFLSGIARPQSAVISSIGPAHIGNLGSLHNIALAKAEILEPLSSSGYAVLPGDDPFFSTLKAQTKASIISFGFSPSNDVAGNDLRVDPTSLSMNISFMGQSYPVRLKLLGRHNASNALAALALFLIQGGDFKFGVERLASFQPVSARMEAVEINDMRVILDCYNANPASMNQAIDFLAVCQGRRVAVLGDMRELGEDSPKLHQELGRKVAQANLDQLISVGELSLNISESALAGGMAPQKVHTCRDTAEAVKTLGMVMSKGDTILLKASRGMHFEKIVKELWPNIPCELH